MIGAQCGARGQVVEMDGPSEIRLDEQLHATESRRRQPPRRCDRLAGDEGASSHVRNCLVCDSRTSHTCSMNPAKIASC